MRVFCDYRRRSGRACAFIEMRGGGPSDGGQLDAATRDKASELGIVLADEIRSWWWHEQEPWWARDHEEPTQNVRGLAALWEARRVSTEAQIRATLGFGASP